MRKRALGEQGIHLIRDTAERVADFERERLRLKVEEASSRPHPGTSDILGRPLAVSEAYGRERNGKLGIVETHDLTAMAPIHLIQMRRRERL